MPVGAIIGAGTSLIGGILGSQAAGKAASQEVNGLQRGADYLGNNVAQGTQKLDWSLNQTLGNLNPYISAGNTGVQQLMAAVGPGGSLADKFNYTPEDLKNDPGYNFQMQQGLQALGNAASARGLATSGGTLKDITQYGQGLASTGFNQAYNRALTTFQTNRSNTLQNITGLLGLGQFGSSTANQDYGNYGNQFSNLMLNSGKSIADIYGNEGLAQGAGTMGAANAWSHALSGIGGAAMGGFQQPSSFMPYASANPFQMPQSPAFPGVSIPSSPFGIPNMPSVGLPGGLEGLGIGNGMPTVPPPIG